MEITGSDYNPHSMIELRKIVDGESTFAYYKATELEDMLWANPTINVIEHMPNGELKERILTRSDISEMFRIAKFRESRLEEKEKQIKQIIDNLTVSGWYGNEVDTSDILSDLCSILDHSPKRTISWRANVIVEGCTEVPIDEVEDFDARYHVDDNLSIDSNDYSTEVNLWYVSDMDNEEWE